MLHPAIVSAILIAQLAAPSDAYRSALDATRNAPVPAYVTYVAHVDPGDATIELERTRAYYAKPRLAFGADFYYAYEWYGAYRTSDGLSRLDFGDGPSFSRLALFDPTWSGASLWLRRGLLGALSGGPTPLEAPSGTPMPNIIADVYAFDPSAYRVTDAGIGWCGTDPARALGLRATRDSGRHPLQRVLVDAISGRICSVRFKIEAEESGSRFDGFAELSYAPVASYYLARESYLSVAVREYGRLVGYAHVRTHFDGERGWQNEPDPIYYTLPPGANRGSRAPEDDDAGPAPPGGLQP